jgi:hypothetical protein
VLAVALDQLWFMRTREDRGFREIDANPPQEG